MKNAKLGELSHSMKDVQGYRQSLSNLAEQWELFTILGQMSGTGTEMTETRQAFAELSEDLLEQLAQENFKKTLQNISSKAQVSVDILIRNLFERTADIGFLATDEDLREFLLGGNSSDDEAVDKLKARFREYVAKYSVYHNIILMDAEGKVLVQMDSKNPVEASSDPLIEEAKMTSAEYVEVFRKTDLVPEEDSALIYAYRVTETNESTSQVLGVLCLCFRFDDELNGIFNNLLHKEDWAVLSILDEDGRVIASSDRYQIPIGAPIDRVLDEEYAVVRFAGREYLAKTFATNGYQGFMGLGWQGHIMLPLEKAFETKGGIDLKERIDNEVLASVMRDPQLFPEDLRAIPTKADAIQENLDLTVWNGNIRQTTQEAKVLLWNISAAGGKTKEIFESSIGNLHETVVSSILEDVEFQAALAVDIMDRNLYERANDCRWWALTSDFRALLEKPSIDAEAREKISGILQYINGLYTVYTNLIVYDLNGKIIAVSNRAEESIVGRTLSEDWIQKTLDLTNSQAYSVSKFNRSDLYASRPTYIYGAVITGLESQKPVGGIGIVFDSEPQFEAMLQDSLPKDDGGKIIEGNLGFFVDRKGVIISSSSENYRPGEKLNIPKEYLACANGAGHSGIIEWEGAYCAVGSRCSMGYREFKTNDGYQNDVIGLVFASLATIQEGEVLKTSSNGFKYKHRYSNTGGETVEVATFFIGSKNFGFQTSMICGAVMRQGLTEVPGSHEMLAGKITYEGKVIPVVSLGKLMRIDTLNEESGKVIVVKCGKSLLGLLVDALGEIPMIPKSMIDFNANLLDESDKYSQGVVMPDDCSDYREMLVLLDSERLGNYLASMETFKVRKQSSEAMKIALDEGES